jgi:hypothetical protein
VGNISIVSYGLYGALLCQTHDAIAPDAATSQWAIACNLGTIKSNSFQSELVETMPKSTVDSTVLRAAWERGVQQGLSQVVINMQRKGMGLSEISQLTGLSTDQIQDLPILALDDSQDLLPDFIAFSESALSEVWLNPEEDEAWQTL